MLQSSVVSQPSDLSFADRTIHCRGVYRRRATANSAFIFGDLQGRVFEPGVAAAPTTPGACAAREIETGRGLCHLAWKRGTNSSAMKVSMEVGVVLLSERGSSATM
jgi:hypothetical protein